MNPIAAALLFGGESGGSSDPIVASSVTYDNTSSGLSSENVQDAIDEVNEKFNALPDSLHYIGTLGTGGTIQILPDPSSHAGELYKCIENGDYYSKEYQYSPTIRKVKNTSGQSLKRYINGVQQADNVFVAYNTDKVLDGVFTYMCRYEGGGPTSVYAEYHSSIQSLVEGAQVKDTNTSAWITLTKNVPYKFVNGDAPGFLAPIFKASVITHLNKDDYVFSDGFDWIKIIGIPESKDITYDNTASGLTATDVNSAIDELNSKIPSDIAAEDVSFTNPDSEHILLPDNTQGVFDALLEGYTNEPVSHSYKYEFTWPSNGSVTCKYSENGTLLETKEVGYWDTYLFRGIQVSRNGVGNPMFTKTAACRNGLVVTINGTQQGVFDNISPVSSLANYATTIVMELAWTDPVEFHSGASYVNYDNTDSGLEATDVQGAIDEVNGKFDTPDMGEFSYDTEGLTALANKILQKLGNFKVFFCTCLLTGYDVPLIIATRRSTYTKILLYTYDYIIILSSNDGTTWSKSRIAYTPF